MAHRRRKHIAKIQPGSAIAGIQSESTAPRQSTNDASMPRPLTVEQQYQIRAEEIYRLEVRNALCPPCRKTMWDYLNSSFVLWILSSVVLTVFAFAYQEMIVRASEQRAIRHRIASELLYRRERAANLTDRKKVLEVLDNRAGLITTFLHDEFENRDLLRLLSLADAAASKKEQAARIQETREKVNASPSAEILSSVRSLAEALEE